MFNAMKGKSIIVEDVGGMFDLKNKIFFLILLQILTIRWSDRLMYDLAVPLVYKANRRQCQFSLQFKNVFKGNCTPKVSLLKRILHACSKDTVFL